MGKNLTTIRGRILELVRKQGFEVSKFFDEVGESYESFKVDILPRALVVGVCQLKFASHSIPLKKGAILSL